MSRLDEIVRAKQREVEALRESTHPGHLRSEGVHADAPRGFLHRRTLWVWNRGQKPC